jgi:CDP-diacylglycerol--glycerol-3-phosphate 3-phosphatidyltransferase
MNNDIKNNQKIWEIDNLPNRLTLFRIALIPVILLMLYLAKSDYNPIVAKQHLYGWISCICFFFACITDFFDGYIARKNNIITVFGSFLDPIADKFLVISVLIMLLSLGRVPDWVVIILVLRELYITSLRLLASNQNISVPVGPMGKWKTTAQMFGIGFLLVGYTWYGIPLLLIGQILIYIASALSLASAIMYSLGLLKRIKAQKKRIK